MDSDSSCSRKAGIQSVPRRWIPALRGNDRGRGNDDGTGMTDARVAHRRVLDILASVHITVIYSEAMTWNRFCSLSI